MSNDIFQIDKKELRALSDFLKKAPKQFHFAASSVLNEQAFDARQNYLDAINSSMTVRSPGYVRKNLRVVKANGRQPLSRQVSFAGSTYGKNFTGWAEQELGTKDQRDRTISLPARSGQWGKRVAPKSRMKPGKKFRSWADHQRSGRRYKHQTKGQATTAMLVDARKRKFNGLFIIERGLPGRLDNFEYGLYGVKGKQLYRHQALDKKPSQPKRNRWMTRGNRKLVSGFNLSASWKKNVERQIKFIK